MFNTVTPSHSTAQIARRALHSLGLLDALHFSNALFPAIDSPNQYQHTLTVLFPKLEEQVAVSLLTPFPIQQTSINSVQDTAAINTTTPLHSYNKMKSFLLASLLLGSLAAASPLVEEKRWVTTEIVIATQTVTVTGTGRRGWWPWAHGSSPTATNTVSVIETTATSSSSSMAAVTTTVVPSVAPSDTPSSPSSAQPTTSAPAETSTGSVSAYADPILQQHNVHRRNHTVDDISWDDNLANIAAEIASSCKYAHNTEAGGGGYGQNIGAGAPGDEVDKMITNQMYNDEMMLYPGYGAEPDMSNFERWGHFSQIVWKATTKVGCHTQYCPGGLENTGGNISPFFTVCNYQPAGKPSPNSLFFMHVANCSIGNFGDQYADNVLQPRGDPIVTV